MLIKFSNILEATTIHKVYSYYLLRTDEIFGRLLNGKGMSKSPVGISKGLHSTRLERTRSE